MQQPGITLQVVAKIHFPVNDLLQIVDRSIVVTAAKIKCGDLVIKNKDAVSVKIEFVFLQHIFNKRHQFQSFFKGAQHKMLVDLGGGEINKGLDLVILHLGNNIGIAEDFKLLQCNFELLVISKVKMRIEQVVYAFDIMSRLNIQHVFFIMKQVHPLLRVAIVHDKILSNKGIPAITLVQVQTFIKTLQRKSVPWQLFLEEFFDVCFVCFIPRVSIL